MKPNKSKTLFYISCFSVFILMLICNFLTGKYSDDFAYCFSYATKERITEISQIFASIKVHGNIMNGRAVAHFFVQLFLLLPSPVFKIINAAVFLLHIVLIYLMCKDKDTHNNLLFWGIFGSVWCFEPAFGQVNLWLDGSCNYLWSIAAGLIFMKPLADRYMYDKNTKNILLRILFVISGFIAGAFLENASAAVIFMAILFVAATRFIEKKRFDLWHIAGICAAICGYLMMMSAPATAKNKAAELDLGVLRVNFIRALEMFNLFRPLLIVFVILLIINISVRADKKKITLAVIFAAGAFCANFILTAASYYPLRCAFCSAVLLTAANAALLSLIFEGNYRIHAISLVSVMLLITSYNVILGVNDIYATELQRRLNVQYLYNCKEQGILDIDLPLVQATTKYSPAYDLKYLDTEDHTTWPNHSMSRYYGINSVIGR